jgi:methylenetetrahydrofolate dehydrogenase (NADP+)/methenyltetrahydrofolate cyclohydrolase
LKESMTAIILKSAPFANDIREALFNEVQAVREQGIHPKLAVILVGEDPGSVWYAESKAKLGEKIGIEVEIHKCMGGVPREDLLDLISGLNTDPRTHGILIELPLPGHLDKSEILGAIDPSKDVDGVTPTNRGHLLAGNESAALVPATPQACVELIEQAGVELRGKRVTLVGRGDTVGRPLAMMLIKRDATITVCHTKTANLAEECRRAEVLVAAAGAKGLVRGDMIAPGAVVIDAGVNETEDGSFIGDVDFDSAVEVAGTITPVPGGVGSLTTTLIMRNVLRAIDLQKRP